MIRQLEGYEKCYVVDSCTATGGQRILVEEAVRLRDQGLGAEETVRTLEKIRSRITLYACIYLRCCCCSSILSCPSSP